MMKIYIYTSQILVLFKTIIEFNYKHIYSLKILVIFMTKEEIYA